jgi:hypothetical protein
MRTQSHCSWLWHARLAWPVLGCVRPPYGSVVTPTGRFGAPARSDVDRSATMTISRRCLFPAFEETVTPATIQEPARSGPPMVIFSTLRQDVHA